MAATSASGKLEDSTPILVGCGDVTDRTTPIEVGRSPFDLISQAAKIALADTGASGVRESIDTVAVVRLFSDTSHRFATKLGSSTNPPKSVADRLGIQAARYIVCFRQACVSREVRPRVESYVIRFSAAQVCPA